MPNIFDRLEASVHRITTKTMGYDAHWLPSDGETPEGFTARVHFKDPNKFGDYFEMESVNYQLKNVVMEFFEGELPGLYEICRGGGNNSERVTISIRGINEQFYIHDIYKLHDGQTFRAVLEYVPA